MAKTKPELTNIMNVRLTPDEKQEFDSACAEEGVTMSQVVRQMVKYWLVSRQEVGSERQGKGNQEGSDRRFGKG